MEQASTSWLWKHSTRHQASRESGNSSPTCTSTPPTRPNFVGSVDPPTDPPSQKTCMSQEEEGAIWPVYVFGGLFLVIVVAAASYVRKHCCKAKEKELSPSKAIASSASMTASPAVQMQHVAYPVAEAVPAAKEQVEMVAQGMPV